MRTSLEPPASPFFRRFLLVWVLMIPLAARISLAQADAKEVPWGDSSLYYRTLASLPLHEADLELDKITSDIQTLDRHLDFALRDSIYVKDGYITTDPKDAEAYYLVDVFEFSEEGCTESPEYIDCKDNPKTFAISVDEFHRRLDSQKLEKRHALSKTPVLRVGTTLSIPFKLRRRTNYLPREITTEASLGGYVAAGWRLSPTREIYINGIFSAGISLLPITAKESAEEDKDKDTNTVPGFTLAGGIVLEMDSFQLGFLIGRDYATGDAGDSWAYDTKTWYALSIGFTFLGAKTAAPSSDKKQE